jgi:hypothetical protein
MTINKLFTNTKQKLNFDQLSKLIYQIICSCEARYTGEVFRQNLGIRTVQHENNCKRIKKLAEKVGLQHETNITAAIANKIDELRKKNEENPALKMDPDPDLLKLAKCCEVSGLTNHYALTGHSFDFSTPRIVDRSNNKFVLGVLEMIHIKLNPGVNKMTDTQNLNPAYFGLLEKRNKTAPISKLNPRILTNNQ